MTLQFSESILAQIHAHGAEAYPQEGAGFLLGTNDAQRTVQSIFSLPNAREEAARHNRYLITAADYLKAELQAERL